ncbi:MAG: VapC toxin family PIN domain ribonuclease [Kineosporiaceae bacterium]
MEIGLLRELRQNASEFVRRAEAGEAAVVRTVLDTSVLIAGDSDPSFGEQAISTITLAELRFGVLRATTADDRAERLALVGRVERRFTPSFDLLIAATAHAHDARLLTLNPDDFRGVEGLVEVASARSLQR